MINKEPTMTDIQHDHLLLTLTDLLIQIDDLRRNGTKTVNGNDIDILYDDLAMIYDRIDPELNRD